MIVVTDLHKSHGDKVILQGVSLEVSKGEVCVLVGPSGGGKSTLLRCINGLETFHQGTVRVGDRTMEPDTPANDPTGLSDLRKRVGMVFQQFHLFPHMTALQNVMSGPLYALGKTKAEATDIARPLLERVGLGDKFDSKPSQLSGGQQQRVAIARALAVHPEVILFDEPTSALDPLMAAEVTAVMNDLAEKGQTMIVVTHDMTFARRTAHKVHVMKAGRIIESGPPATVLREHSEGTPT